MNAPNAVRVAFFVDGFNLYHSTLAAERHLRVCVKWLDLSALCAAHLHPVGPNAEISCIRYFTAFAHHLNKTRPGKLARHQAYVRALTASGVKVHIGHFKQKTVTDTWTAQEVITHEEKETDVAIASAVLEAAVTDQLDTAVLVTGDTDLRPAVHSFHRLFPAKRLVFAFPFACENRELAQAAPSSFSLSAESYLKYQFPDRVQLPSGKFVTKPTAWAQSPSSEANP